MPLGSFATITDLSTATGKIAYLATNATTFQTVLNVASGSGFLTGIMSFAINVSVAAYIKVTIDGTVQLDGADYFNSCVSSSGMSSGLNCIHRFNSSLKVEVKNSAAQYTRTYVAYTLE